MKKTDSRFTWQDFKSVILDELFKNDTCRDLLADNIANKVAMVANKKMRRK